MFARVTQFEIDVVQISERGALELFQKIVLPELAAEPGYMGLLVLQSPGGRGMLVSLWDSPEAERAGRDRGFYSEQVQKFATFYRQPPGRDAFEVTYQDLAKLALVGGVR